MNWYKKNNIIKIAETRYLYHGTGVQNLSTILSEGLSTDADKLYDNKMDHGSIQTYGGTYLTNNIMTALSSAGKSSDLSGSKDKGLVIVKIEDTTPHIVLDEDNFPNPAGSIGRANSYDICGSQWSPDNLAYFILNTLPNVINNISYDYLQSFKNMRHENTDQRIFDALIPYAKNVVETYCYSSLAAQVNNYFQGTYEYQKKIFEETYPQFAGIDEAQAASEYRSSHDILIQKAHRLTSDIEQQFSGNVRSMENISYRGKNKIVMVSSVLKGSSKKYYTEVDIIYLSDNSCLDQFINDITERLGRSLLVKHNGNILYDNPREEKVASNVNWYKKAQFESNSNDGDVENFISKRTGLQIQYDDYEWDSVGGKSIDFINDHVLVDTEIKETENEIYLTGIQTRNVKNRKENLTGSGKGTEVVNALKEYADTVNKKLIILDFTEQARPYWNKFKNFTEEGQFYDIDGKNTWIQNTKQYTPNSEDNY